MKIFISYCTDDKETVETVINCINGFEPINKIDFFYSGNTRTGVTPGDDIVKTITDNITNSDIVLLFVTFNYINSMYCLYELSVARSQNKHIVPIVFNEDCWNNIKDILGNNTNYIKEDGLIESIYGALSNNKCLFQKEPKDIDTNQIFKIHDNNERISSFSTATKYKETYKYFLDNDITYFANQSLKQADYAHFLNGAKKLMILSTTGANLVKNISKQIIDILTNGGEVTYLLANKDSEFCIDVAEIEDENSFIGNLDRISREFNTVIGILNTCYKAARQQQPDNLGHLYVGSSLTLLRQTITIVDGYTNDNEKGWAFVSLTIPPKQTRAETPSLMIETNNRNDIGGNESLFCIFLNHYNKLVEYAKHREAFIEINDSNDLSNIENGFKINNSKLSMTRKEWDKKVQNATKYYGCGNGRRDSILLEVAAQHPLKDGNSPNEEFALRLDKAIAFYKANKKNSDIYFYVPGSLHIGDEISLSEAGKKYLIDNKIPENLIYGDDMNKLYKPEQGVYNSADECFVTVQIAKDFHISRIISICSVFQTLKKELFYIANGALVQFDTVSPIQMFHDPIREALDVIPYTLYNDPTWQGNDSYLGNKSRKERNPNFKK